MPKLPVNEPCKGVPIEEPSVKTHDVDLLIVGGGMGACGVAYEAVRWGDEHGLKIMLCDKAALERSGAVAQGLSAINTYLGKNTADDYVRMVRTDLMGIVREDLIFDVGRHVDDSVHLFEEWGLPIWVKEDGHNLNGAQAKAKGLSIRKGADPVRSGRWQIMINGESYKCIVAEAAKNALGEDRIMERMFIVKLLLDKNEPNRIAGAVGFNLRENAVHIFKANAIMVGAGGAVNIYRPRSMGEGMGRAWYPVWNAGSTYTLCAQVGAEMTMMENRFVPARFKDGYGPVGAWFLLFKAKATNSKGEDYCATNKDLLKPYEARGYAKGNVIPTCLRNHMMIKEMRDGRGPIYMDTKTALNKTFATMDEEQQKDLESEAWEDFLDMCVGQANLWACSNTMPEERGSEIMPTEPYLLGSHSGCCGIWVSGPDEKWVPEEYKIHAKNGRIRPQILIRLPCRRTYRRQADGPLLPRPQGLQAGHQGKRRRTPQSGLCSLLHLEEGARSINRSDHQPELHSAQKLHDAPDQGYRRIRRWCRNILPDIQGNAGYRLPSAHAAGRRLRQTFRARPA